MQPAIVEQPQAVSSPKGKPLRLLKWTGILGAVATTGVLLYKLYIYYTVLLPTKGYSKLLIVGQHVVTFTDLALCIIAFIILCKARTTSSFFLALAIIGYEINVHLPEERTITNLLLLTLTGALTGTLLVLSFQRFPRKINVADIVATIRFSWLRRYLKTWLSPRFLWLGFFGGLVGLGIADYLVRVSIDSFTSLVILLTAFGYLYVNFRRTTGIVNARILWLFWGLLMYILLQLSFIAIFMNSTGAHNDATILLMIASSLVLFFSFAMSLFFADTFDTGRFVSRTAESGIIFVLAVIVYNTLEHYVLHWLAHTLHINNVLLSSLLSGVIVLCISPVHHRLTSFLNKRLRTKQAAQHHD